MASTRTKLDDTSDGSPLRLGCGLAHIARTDTTAATDSRCRHENNGVSRARRLQGGLRRDNIVLLGWSHITFDVVRQLQKQRELHRYQHKVHVNIVGFGSKCCDFLYNSKGFSFEELISRQASCICSTSAAVSASQSTGQTSYSGPLSLEQLDQLQDLAIPILADCSGQSSAQDLHSACMERGIYIVASNACSVCRLPPTSSRESVATTHTKTAVAEGKRLHYVASIDLAKFPFSSVQYSNPLVVNESGTGAAASATGVLRDVITILNLLNGKNVHV
ncbi:unnamed protein product [Peronospora destructor]|uniref:Aspartate/homoserine dehydrogenase NAD-binding domain-containing protein n=1 Tax=Peronospora destructor TaxID=86335 RepID=A0AAV0VG38_9STRA|nr:unnamed protein product [Peronospora destructor]